MLQQYNVIVANAQGEEHSLQCTGNTVAAAVMVALIDARERWVGPVTLLGISLAMN